MVKPWVKRAHELIGLLCEQSYLQQNPRSKIPGTKRRHKPYAVPQLAEDLIKCLKEDDEHGAKCIFLSYDGIKVLRDRDERNSKR